jgi:addiction module HigA family antidote
MKTMETMSRRSRRPSLPGEILSELYLAPYEISIAAFAEACGVSRKHMSGIVNGHVAITAEMAARIATVLGTTAQYWLNLQNAVDLYDAELRLADSDNRPQLMAAFAQPSLQPLKPETIDCGAVRHGSSRITAAFPPWRRRLHHRRPPAVAAA